MGIPFTSLSIHNYCGSLQTLRRVLWHTGFEKPSFREVSEQTYCTVEPTNTGEKWFSVIFTSDSKSKTCRQGPCGCGGQTAEWFHLPVQQRNRFVQWRRGQTQYCTKQALPEISCCSQVSYNSFMTSLRFKLFNHLLWAVV